jgi:hypothetical protein
MIYVATFSEMVVSVLFAFARTICDLVQAVSTKKVLNQQAFKQASAILSGIQ